MLPHPQATSTDHGGPRTSDLSIERRRRNHFTTAPLTAVVPLLKNYMQFFWLFSVKSNERIECSYVGFGGFLLFFSGKSHKICSRSILIFAV